MAGSPSAEALAHRILKSAPETDSVEEAVARLLETLGTLEGAMSGVMGDGGYRAIFTRCVGKTKREYAVLARVTFSASAPVHDTVAECLRQTSAETVAGVGAALLAEFIDLVGSLIGEDLTLRLFEKAWPEAAVRARGPEKS